MTVPWPLTASGGARFVDGRRAVYSCSEATSFMPLGYVLTSYTRPSNISIWNQVLASGISTNYSLDSSSLFFEARIHSELKRLYSQVISVN